MARHLTHDSRIANVTLTPEYFNAGLLASDMLYDAMMALNSGSPRMADGAGPEARAAAAAYAKANGVRVRPGTPGPFYYTEKALLETLKLLYPTQARQVLDRAIECGERPRSAAVYVLEEIIRADRESALQDMLEAHDDGRHVSGDPFFITNCPACRQGTTSPLVQLYPEPTTMDSTSYTPW
jgi:hypothetical protein